MADYTIECVKVHDLDAWLPTVRGPLIEAQIAVEPPLDLSQKGELRRTLGDMVFVASEVAGFWEKLPDPKLAYTRAEFDAMPPEARRAYELDGRFDIGEEEVTVLEQKANPKSMLTFARYGAGLLKPEGIDTVAINIAATLERLGHTATIHNQSFTRVPDNSAPSA